MANPTLTGVSAGGTAGSLTPEPNFPLVGVAAGAAMGAVQAGNVILAGVAATGAAEPPASYTIEAHPIGAAGHSVGAAVNAFSPPIAIFPLARLMRDTPVPTIGAMSNAAVPAVGNLFPSGPARPVDRQVSLNGVSATAAAASVGGGNNVTAAIVGAMALPRAGVLTSLVS